VDLSKRLRLLGVRIGNLSHPGDGVAVGTSKKRKVVRRVDGGGSAKDAAEEPRLESLELF